MSSLRASDSGPPKSARAALPGDWLICFAMKEEASAFSPPDDSVRILITGMGRANTQRALRQALATRPQALVLTCGFAGGLDPALKRGTVLFSADHALELGPFLAAAGAKSAIFFCADRIAVTAAEKRALRQNTGADAVEMESQHVASVCREQGIPCVTLRVILDTADEDLPLDFNQLTTADLQMDYKKLAGLIHAGCEMAALRRSEVQS